ncbi:MAG: hypothetical protein EXR71_03175 [Myxococcales bacterium]|nr:hypothetical protein [Myxococcales bacterium]
MAALRRRLLLVDPDLAFRLRAIATLAEEFDVTVPVAGDDIIRLARATRPELALFAAGGRLRVEAMRVTRVLKTDVRVVPTVAFYSRTGESPPPRAGLIAVMVDAYLPDAGADDLGPFAHALGSGERPMPEPWPAVGTSRLRRALTRILGQ